MAVLVFRHVPFEHLGRIAPALEDCGVPIDYVDLYREPDRPVDLASADGLVLMGGPMSANDNFPFLQRELSILRDATATGKPILGICLGAQLIAKALGARVYRNPVKEIGWYPINWTPAAAGDPLLAGLSGADTVFHWHGETFDLPAGAVGLASSEACRNQAFCWGTMVYGFQFHLEVTPEMIADWLRQGANSRDVRALSTLPDPQANAARLEQLSSLIFGRWTSLLRD